MKKLLCLLLILISVQTFADGGDLGIGVIIGNPTGLSMNYKLGTERSIDGALAFDLDADEASIHSTYLFHYINYGIDLIPQPLHWYMGLGARLLLDDRGNDDDEVIFGIRGSLGAAYHFKQNPFELFGELAPTMNITEDTDLDLDAAIGVRYYF